MLDALLLGLPQYKTSANILTPDFKLASPRMQRACLREALSKYYKRQNRKSSSLGKGSSHAAEESIIEPKHHKQVLYHDEDSDSEQWTFNNIEDDQFDSFLKDTEQKQSLSSSKINADEIKYWEVIWMRLAP